MSTRRAALSCAFSLPNWLKLTATDGRRFWSGSNVTYLTRERPGTTLMQANGIVSSARFETVHVLERHLVSVRPRPEFQPYLTLLESETPSPVIRERRC